MTKRTRPDPVTGDDYPNPTLRALMRREAQQIKGCHSCYRGEKVLGRWACDNGLHFPSCQGKPNGYVPKEKR